MPGAPYRKTDVGLADGHTRRALAARRSGDPDSDSFRGRDRVASVGSLASPRLSRRQPEVPLVADAKIREVPVSSAKCDFLEFVIALFHQQAGLFHSAADDVISQSYSIGLAKSVPELVGRDTDAVGQPSCRQRPIDAVLDYSADLYEQCILALPNQILVRACRGERYEPIQTKTYQFLRLEPKVSRQQVAVHHRHGKGAAHHFGLNVQRCAKPNKRLSVQVQVLPDRSSERAGAKLLHWGMAGREARHH